MPEAALSRAINNHDETASPGSVLIIDDEAAIRVASRRLIEDREPDPGLPPRHLVAAAAYALESGRVAPARLSGRVVARLAARHPPAPATIPAAQAALAA